MEIEILGVKLHHYAEAQRGLVVFHAESCGHIYAVIDRGSSVPARRRYAANVGKPLTMPRYKAEGATAEEAVAALHASMVAQHHELGAMMRPYYRAEEALKNNSGEPHPGYGDLMTRTEFASYTNMVGEPDGSYHPADEKLYYPNLPWHKRTAAHTHVMYFPK